MRASKKDLPVTGEMAGAKFQEVDWGDMHVEFDTFEKTMDVTPLLKGLPDNLDPCPHWGYVLKGTVRIRQKDGKEDICKAGDAYYAAPGHTAVVEGGTEVLEISPKELLKKTMEVMMRNMQAAGVK